MSVELNPELKARFARLAELAENRKKQKAIDKHKTELKKWLDDDSENGGAIPMIQAAKNATKNGVIYPDDFLKNFPQLGEKVNDNLLLNPDSKASRERQLTSFAIGHWRSVLSSTYVADTTKPQLEAPDRIEAIEQFEKDAGFSLTIAPEASSNRQAILATILRACNLA